jgi:cell fate regulator YaaT (PSP1 superfamily)
MNTNDLRYVCGQAAHGLSSRGCHIGHYCQLNTYDYLADIPGCEKMTDLVEVQFKNTRKGYYHNLNGLALKKGDIVAVEASPGHDIGTVTLTGKLVPLQMKKANLKSQDDIKRIYRIAREADMEKFNEAKAREHDTMIRSRQIAKDLGLEMKIGDVEYQGDGNKAIFYYIADGRVDFRQLIKVLAEAFRVRIEMKQIGARQEAGRIGGFGPCGRELCCATWMKSFVSVGTTSARYQDLSLNPQKLAGQCAKLKCCMNYEVDQYIEAAQKLPGRDIVLQSQDGDYHFFKADLLSQMVTYSTDKRIAANLVVIPAARAIEVIAMNREGIKPDTLEEGGHKEPDKPLDLAVQEDLNRFDKKKKKKKKKKKGSKDGASAANRDGASAVHNGDAGAAHKDGASAGQKEEA